MARVGFPLLSYDVRGKVGNIVFYQRGGRQYARVRVKPRNPKSPAQMRIRVNARRLMQAWAGSGLDVITDPFGQRYVVLIQYNPMTGQERQINFNVLTNQEKEEWLNKYGSYAPANFSGANVRRLLNGLEPIRTPS